MSQYTFSFVNSEYERIPLELKENLDSIIGDADVDPKTKEFVAQICNCVEKAVADLAKYSKDQLHL